MEKGDFFEKCPHCDYKSKLKGTLKTHLTYKHDIGVVWHECPHCNSKAKTKSALKSHLA